MEFCENQGSTLTRIYSCDASSSSHHNRDHFALQLVYVVFFDAWYSYDGLL